MIKGSPSKVILAAFFLSLAVFGGEMLASQHSTSVHAEDSGKTNGAANSLGTIDPSKYSVSIATSGTVAVTLETVPSTNVVRAGKDSITTTIVAPSTVSSTNKAKLYIATDSTTSNDLTLSGSSTTIPATSGTVTSPTTLTGNSWGFALANTTTGIVSPNGFDSSYTTPDPGKTTSKWAAVPTKGNEQLIQSIPMNQPTTNTDIYYAVSATDSLAEGTYTGNIVYTAIYDATDITDGELTFSPTSGTAGDTITVTTSAVSTMDDIGGFLVNFKDSSGNLTACENITTSKTADNLIQATCTVPTLTAAGNYTLQGTLEKTGQTYTSTDTFAYTAPTTVTTFDDAYTAAAAQDPTITRDDTTGLWKMKDMNSDICSTVTTATTAGTEQTTQLVDMRDGKTYTIGKLMDGNCWMLDNLRLGGSDTIDLTPDDTNIASDYTLPASTTTGFEWGTTGFTNALINTDSIDTTTTSYGSGSGKVGVYYNFCAASAGTICQDWSESGSDAEYDVCPIGWRMPSSGDTGEYNSLYTAYDSSTENLRVALSTPLSGSYGYGAASGQGVYGFFWFSTYYANSIMYGLYLEETIDPLAQPSRFMGISMRCVAK